MGMRRRFGGGSSGGGLYEADSVADLAEAVFLEEDLRRLVLISTVILK
jgi:hypothetical protein